MNAVAIPTPLDALIEARAMIAKPYAWVKGKWHGKNEHCKCYCALGAVREVYGINKLEATNTGSYDKPLYDAFYGTEALLCAATPGEWDDIVSYNDDGATKKQDILKTFDRAIATLKEQA